MITDATFPVAALLHGDGTVPTGGFGFSWGLETLQYDGLLDGSEPFVDLLNWHVRTRWVEFDRYYLCRSMDTDTEGRHALDQEVEASILSQANRSASIRAGRAFLGSWGRAGSAVAQAYKTAVGCGRAHGHLPIVQGLVYVADGLDQQTASMVSVWTMISNLSSVAVRLGIVSAVTAQKALHSMVPLITDLLDAPLPDAPQAWTPLQDIAMERHGAQPVRLFAS